MIKNTPRSVQVRSKLLGGIWGLFALALLGLAAPAWSLITYTDEQRETIVELVEQLEKRHYAKLEYDDLLSSMHLDNYIDSLDGGKMYFTSADLAEFERFRNAMDEELHAGHLEAGFTIFNRFQQRLEARLSGIIDTLPARIDAMDFTVDEDYRLDGEDRDWATDLAELDNRWRLHIKNQVLSLRLAEKEGDDIAEVLEKRYRNQLNRVKQYNHQDVFQIYANALTELYDPHTSYLSPRRSENFNINMSLSLEGIGAVLQLEDEYTKVARIVPAGPADKQGELRPSDKIIAVAQGEDGAFEDVIGWRLDEVVELIRGPKDTTVRLQIIPGKAATADMRQEITIVRNQVKLEEQSAQKEILEIPAADGGDMIKIGVIDIPAFYIDFDAMRRGEDDYKSTTRDVKVLLDELQDEGVEGIIIDLRHNGGGSLQEANELTGLFIEYGPTVQIRHSSRRVWRDGKRARTPYYDGPLLVMINRLSASASEIFAGAIQDYQRGIIAGDRSFGKGTVQTMLPLTEGQLKLTESKFYRISGDSTQHRGVVPDVTFPSMFDPDEIGESALEHALNWDQINPVRHRRYGDIAAIVPDLTRLFASRSAKNPDFVYLEDQVNLAEEARSIKTLPLNEKARIAMREEQELKALAIENRRRAAQGKELLTSLEDAEVEDSAPLEETGEQTDEEALEEADDASDVLLGEAGQILADALRLRQQSIAQHTPVLVEEN
ncbi:carboxy terminal-processing peptidase [Kineobactrum sediminis]|uniref:carboxy terminal-processing peptidase n=1 Tax=Kineobactrum sediminis TaxID=1905677 RepID=UPI001F4EF50E|nr:carboxy terminal-processing peptidase [Kineobactrum sediminis]